MWKRHTRPRAALCARARADGRGEEVGARVIVVQLTAHRAARSNAHVEARLLGVDLRHPLVRLHLVVPLDELGQRASGKQRQYLLEAFAVPCQALLKGAPLHTAPLS